MSKPKPKHKCPYDTLTEEDMGTLSWLSSIVAQGAKGNIPTAKKFRDAHIVVGKLLKAVHSQHELLHARDAELRHSDAITNGLLGLTEEQRLGDGTVN